MVVFLCHAEEGMMLGEYEKAVEEFRSEFIDACKSIFGDKLTAIIAKGSTVKGGFIPGLSDIDLHVYLEDEAFAFSDFPKLELGLRFQEKMDGLIRKYDFGGSLIQVIFINISQMRGWSAPVDGSYLLLYGDVCPEPPPTVEGMLEKDRLNLQNPTYAYGLIASMADKTSDHLADYVRRLNIAVTPTLYRVLSLLTCDPFRIWKMTRFEVLEELAQLDSEDVKQFAENGRRFFDIARQVSRLQKDLELCKSTIRLGFEVVDFGREIGYRLEG